MPCGEIPQDCGADHLAPVLDLRCGGQGQWNGQCPACKGNFSLGCGTKGRRFVWTCWRKPARGGLSRCTDSAIREAMLTAGISEQCIAIRRGRHRGSPSTAEQKAITDIALMKCSPTARRIALLLLAGQTAAEARADLKLPESTYYDAMKSLFSQQQNRRSGGIDNVCYC